MKTWNLKKLIVVIGGVPISGFGENDAITFDHDEDEWEKVVGADGEVTRSRNNNRSGSITITLMQTSDSNDALEAIRLIDETTGAGIVGVLVKDLTGRTVIGADRAWVRKRPSLEFGKRAGEREWILDCDQVAVFAGGSSPF